MPDTDTLSPGEAASAALRALAAEIDFTKLLDTECWWRDRQHWLARRGYMLRPRYRPAWVPLWRTLSEGLKMDAEDLRGPGRAFLLDAVRMSDNSLVMLKHVKKSWYPHEVDIHKYLCSDGLRSDPRNHTVPLLEVLDVPDDDDATILVMPFLRTCWDPSWQTVGEVVSFVEQILEGLLFMHEHNIAHRDTHGLNIMYDPQPMWPDMFHPVLEHRTRDWKGTAKHSTRTANPVRYYLIDFGLSRKYNPDDGPPREHPIRGGDKSVPEFKNWNGELLDPFPTDIYYLGNMIRGSTIMSFRGVEFLAPLVKDMIHQDPAKRPTIQEVVWRFNESVKSLSRRKLRSRLVHRKEDAADTFIFNIAHTFRTARYIMTRKQAIPRPS